MKDEKVSDWSQLEIYIEIIFHHLITLSSVLFEQLVETSVDETMARECCQTFSIKFYFYFKMGQWTGWKVFFLLSLADVKETQIKLKSLLLLFERSTDKNCFRIFRLRL